MGARSRQTRWGSKRCAEPGRLGCRGHLAGIVGRDEPGRWLLRTLREAGINTSAVIQSSGRATTLKTRVMARGQHMLRIDRETRAAIDAKEERRL